MKIKDERKRVLITSYYYPPETTPRAFRTHELVKEFSRKGYLVDLYLPENSRKSEYDMENNCRYQFINSKKKVSVDNKSKKTVRKKGGILSYFYLLISRFLRYIIGGDPRALRYGCNLLAKLLNDVPRKEYDLIISIGLPFYIHLATAIFLYRTKQPGVKICDYGDPFYYNPAHKKIFFLKYVEKWTVNRFDYISIPTDKSINYYLTFKNDRKIRIIPQGFDFTSTEIEDYSRNVIPTFCYAGVFYKSIRNPEYLLDFLLTLDIPFRFVVYTQVNNLFFQEILSKYKDKMGEKLIIHNFIPRESLIKEMSKMDFLINLNNDNSNQVPSKVIDYGLTQRPVLSINKSTFNPDVLLDFIHGNYSEALQVNIEEYDIRKVTRQFEELLETES